MNIPLKLMKNTNTIAKFISHSYIWKISTVLYTDVLMLLKQHYILKLFLIPDTMIKSFVTQINVYLWPWMMYCISKQPFVHNVTNLASKQLLFVIWEKNKDIKLNLEIIRRVLFFTLIWRVHKNCFYNSYQKECVSK